MLKRLRPAPVMLVLLLIVLADSQQSTEAQSESRFQDTTAAKAFIAMDYSLALDEFLKLRESNPNNTLILRYLAITLDQLGRYEDAINIYNEAIASAPTKPSLYYHLGVTYYNARKENEAVTAFNTAISLAKDSTYAEMSHAYLDAIGQQVAQQQQVGAPQRFSAYVQAGYQDNNNVLAAHDSADLSPGAKSFTGYVNLDYYLINSPVWIATASLNAYGNKYKDDTYESFETSQIGGGLRFQRTGTMGKYPYIGSFNYTYRETELSDGEPYSKSHSATFGLRLNLTGNTATYGYYRYTDDNFLIEGFDPIFSSRDADNHVIGLSQTWFFAERQGQVSFGLDYEKNDADGVNFVMDGLGANIAAAFPLPWTLRLDLNASYGEDNYSKFAGPVRRETDQSNLSASLSRWFGRYFQVQLNYSNLDEKSSYDELSYDSTTWGVNLNYVY